MTNPVKTYALLHIDGATPVSLISMVTSAEISQFPDVVDFADFIKGREELQRVIALKIKEVINSEVNRYLSERCALPAKIPE